MIHLTPQSNLTVGFQPASVLRDGAAADSWITLLAYTFDVVAWQGWDNRRWSGVPDNPQDAKGLKVVATNGESHQFWVYTLNKTNPYQDWAEWWVYIGAKMTQHGMPLEDDTGGGGPIEPPEDEDDEEEEEEEEPAPRPGIIKRVIGWLFGRR